MTDSTIYDSVNTLADWGFIAGTDKTLTFTAYQDNGLDLLDISTGSAKWLLCRYGDYETTVLEKSGSMSTNSFTITLDAADTILLSGKFIQQITIIDTAGNEFRPGQGIVFISPAIPAA
jgi:hypothetical protein